MKTAIEKYSSEDGRWSARALEQLSNYVRTSAIPWTSRVCEEFEKKTGVKLLYELPRQGYRNKTTEINFHTRVFEFDERMMFSDEFIESGNETVVVGILARKYQNKSS